MSTLGVAVCGSLSPVMLLCSACTHLERHLKPAHLCMQPTIYLAALGLPHAPRILQEHGECDLLLQTRQALLLAEPQLTPIPILMLFRLWSVLVTAATWLVPAMQEHLRCSVLLMDEAGSQFVLRGIATRFHSEVAMQEHPRCSVLLMDEAGSVGLDLSFVPWVFLMEPLENASLEEQVISRAHRMGAKAAVQVETLVMRVSLSNGTPEPVIFPP